MKTKPLISVILPVRNAEKYLYYAVQSILRQTYKELELIIIDDCSSDSTHSIVKRFKDTRIKTIRNNIHSGVAYSLNQGILRANGILIARMDADDISMPERFEKQVNFLLKHPHVGVLGTGVEKINDSGQSIGQDIFPRDHESLVKMMSYTNPLRHPTVLVRKSLFANCGYYDEEIEGAEDYDLWLRYARYTRVETLLEPLVQYRLSKSSVSYRENQRIERAFRKAKMKSILVYGYPWWHFAFILKSVVSEFIPLPIKQYIYTKILDY